MIDLWIYCVFVVVCTMADQRVLLISETTTEPSHKTKEVENNHSKSASSKTTTKTPPTCCLPVLKCFQSAKKRPPSNHKERYEIADKSDKSQLLSSTNDYNETLLDDKNINGKSEARESYGEDRLISPPPQAPAICRSDEQQECFEENLRSGVATYTTNSDGGTVINQQKKVNTNTLETSEHNTIQPSIIPVNGFGDVDDVNGAVHLNNKSVTKVNDDKADDKNRIVSNHNDVNSDEQNSDCGGLVAIDETSSAQGDLILIGQSSDEQCEKSVVEEVNISTEHVGNLSAEQQVNDDVEVKVLEGAGRRAVDNSSFCGEVSGKRVNDSGKIIAEIPERFELEENRSGHAHVLVIATQPIRRAPVNREKEEFDGENYVTEGEHFNTKTEGADQCEIVHKNFFESSQHQQQQKQIAVQPREETFGKDNARISEEFRGKEENEERRDELREGCVEENGFSHRTSDTVSTGTKEGDFRTLVSLTDNEKVGADGDVRGSPEGRECESDKYCDSDKSNDSQLTGEEVKEEKEKEVSGVNIEASEDMNYYSIVPDVSLLFLVRKGWG